MLTMLLVGLWHGANWQFVLWGGYYGVLLVGYRAYRQLTAGTRFRTMADRRAFIPVAVATTTIAGILPLVLFRTRTLQETGMVFQSLFDLAAPSGESLLTAQPCALFLIAFVLALIEERSGVIQRMATARTPLQIAGYVIVFLALELFAVTEQRIPFVYFQF